MELDGNSKINAMRRQRPGNIAIERTGEKKSYMQFTGVEEVCININKP